MDKIYCFPRIASFVAHLPGILIEDEIVKFFCFDPETNAIDPSKIFGVGVFGSNGIDVVEHPDGDGYFIVGGNV